MTLNFQVFEGVICHQIQNGNSADWLPESADKTKQKQNKENMLNSKFVVLNVKLILILLEIALQYQFLDYYQGSDE